MKFTNLLMLFTFLHVLNFPSPPYRNHDLSDQSLLGQIILNVVTSQKLTLFTACVAPAEVIGN